MDGHLSRNSEAFGPWITIILMNSEAWGHVCPCAYEFGAMDGHLRMNSEGLAPWMIMVPMNSKQIKL